MSQETIPEGYALVRLADRFVYWQSDSFVIGMLDLVRSDWLEALREPARGGVAGAVRSTEEAFRSRENAGCFEILAHPFLLEGIEVALLVVSAGADASGSSPWESRDKVTGLADRRALELHLATLMQAGGSEEVTLLFIDLDGFKEVNDQFGHLVGDEVLAAIGKRLGALVRGSDFIARFGGDEFVILVRGAHSPEQLDRLIARLRGAIEQAVETSGGIACVGVSVGIAVSTEGFVSPRDWLAAADRRMYDEKRRGRQGEALRGPASER